MARATGADDASGADYVQPTPRRLYVHDDLTDEARRRLGADSPAMALVRELLDLLRRDRERVTILSLEEQVESLARQGTAGPHEVTLAIGRAGETVAGHLHARTGHFPHVRRIDLAREEDGRGGYALIGMGAGALERQLVDLARAASVAVVDDTVFSGLTMRSVLTALSPPVRARTRAFCLRGVAGSIADLAALCPIRAGVAAPGRILEDVSFINATGLVLRVSIRRRGREPLAFFDRPEWLRAWFPGYHGAVLELCRRLNALLEPTPP